MLWFAPTPALSQQLVDNIPASNATPGGAVSVGFTRDVAQSFGTGGHSDGYTVTSVDLVIPVVSGRPTPVYTVGIWSASSGLPNTSLGALTAPNPIVDGVNTFTTSGIDLAANTTYFVVVDITTSGTEHAWQTTTSLDENRRRAPGWTISDFIHTRRLNPFATWARTTSPAQMRISGVARNATNIPPVSYNSTRTTTEDTEFTYAIRHFRFYDADDGATLVNVRIVTLPASDKGTLTLNGANVSANDSVTRTQIRDGNLKYIPPANAHGSNYASFTFKVSDGTDESATYTVTMSITPMNDPATGAPTISGTAQMGQTLTAATTGIVDVDGLTSPTYGYQWIRVDADGTSNPTDIAGAASGTYTQVRADVGKKLRVKVSFTDDDGNDEELTSAPTATETVLDPTVGICGRTEQVRDALVDLIPGVSHCADVTAPHLAGITGTLLLSGENITALAAGDFEGLTALTSLDLSRNGLTALPADVFEGLTALTSLDLSFNDLATLPGDVFDGLTLLEQLYLNENDLATLDADVFDGLTSLTDLDLSDNFDLATLPADVFDGLTSLTDLDLSFNDLDRLPADVFDGLTSLTDLDLGYNDLYLSTLPDDVFEPLTALTDLALGGNPGAPFAPEAVALPDDGMVSSAGGMVTLDGSGSGGPWGTNVTYGWALTEPASGVTVTFDDAASAMPVVTIPALATGTGLTFTLTVTGRGGTDGIAPATDAATVTVDPGICGRTLQVRNGLVALIPGASNCADVTASHLAAITGTLTLSNVGLAALAAGDFDGLTALRTLRLERNQLATLPDDVFEPLTSLEVLFLHSNALTTLDAEVFDELTSLDLLYLQNNQLSTLPDDVFEPLTSLTSLILRDNPGAPFAPEAVALPDDGMVSAAGGMVTLDGSGSDGGPWGTNVTYGWALTDPVSGVTVTFDDAASATPVVTIPALARDTELTFTLTVTGRGGTDGIAPATDTATVTVDPGICGRTLQVRNGLLALISGVSHCADVTATHLAAITGTLTLNSVGLTALAAGDFEGLTALSGLSLGYNDLTTLRADVFDGLTSLSELSLNNNELTTLDDDVFEPLTALTRLSLQNNQLTTLDDDVFEPLTALTELYLFNNNLATLDAGVFAGLTALMELSLNNNDLTTLPDDVFAGLTSLTDLSLSGNDLTTLPDDVFEPLTALTDLALSGNPGAPFAPEAVALPDDGTVSNGGGTVTLDGSGSGGPWGTNVTYGWALTEPASGVTVTFDDAASATPVVTIPALATDPELTFTLTVTGRGGTDGIAPATDTATVTAMLDPTLGICGRTLQVRDALVALIPGVSHCADVTAPDLAAITGTLTLSGENITALAAGDFEGLAALTQLSLYDNALATLDDGVFDGLTALERLSLNDNVLTTLDAGVFAGLTSLTELLLTNNDLSTLSDDVFDGLTALEQLYLGENDLATLPADVFDGLTSLEGLHLSYNDLATLLADVFDGLTALTDLDLSGNDLSTLPDDVFEPLTALTTLDLRINPGAPFAPEAVALPDDGTVSNGGGTVTLDGSGSGGPWGTNVTYGWALTNPASGVTVTFDDAASATPVVTIPALATDPELTFTLTVTGRGGTDGITPATDTATVTAMLDPTLGICGRTLQVRDALVALIPGVSHCADVTAPDLAAITGTLRLSGENITALAAGDFEGLTALPSLDLSRNGLTALPADVFNGLTALTSLALNRNGLTALPADVFNGLTALTSLVLSYNDLATLDDDVFDGLTSLEQLYLGENDLATLPADVFDGLTSLEGLHLSYNDLTTLPDDVFDGLTALTDLSLSANDLTTLPDDVFEPLTALTDLSLSGNDLTTLPDDVFEPLTALTDLALSGNPGAPFAPEAVALPDDGTVSNGGGTVTLDGSGSGSGGPWGTNVTYGWALTDPTSGVTVTFDDAASAMPVVTIPALATGTGLTFTLTVTGRGGTDGIAPATDTATVTAILDPTGGICGRPLQVRDALVALIPSVSHCADVTATHLAAITGTLRLSSVGLTALAAGDFDGLTSLRRLFLTDNALATLPDDVFDGLTALSELHLQNNQLTTLDDDVFEPLTALRDLHLADNALATLPDDVFDGLTALSELYLQNNRLTTLPDDVFEPLTALSELHLQNNQLTTLPDDVFEPLTALGELYLQNNALATLPEGVFDGLTSLMELYLQDNQLTMLPDDVFEPLTALTRLTLRGNPGASFAPEAVALPDDGTVITAGGMVTLDGSGSDGGPWGTNVTYGWALTEPASGVTVTFDDATSATPEVTIPALAEGTGLTFTLTVTGRGGTDGIAPATDTATVTVVLGICERTLQVRNGLVDLIPGVSHCSAVTTTQLAAITGTLRLTNNSIDRLAAGDFDGLTSLGVLSLQENRLTTLPDGVFDDLTSLIELVLNNNRLTTLPDDVFQPLTALRSLTLEGNRLTTLDDGMFAGLTALAHLDLGSNQLTTVPDDMFDDLTSLQTLSLDFNNLATLPAGVFDELTALTDLSLVSNQLTTLPDDVFEPLTALTGLTLRGNPGAPFAPEAVALPDDGTVSAAGGMVTLDGSGSDGGPWGTNVTYGWALTDPVSGVTVTFDDDTSATPEVTIPALATDTGLTFTLTVTGRGGTDGIVPGTDTATVTTISDDATLSALTVNDGTNDLTLAPPFASGTFAYAADVAHAVDEVTLSATVNHAGAAVSAVTLNGTAVADGDFTDGITVSGLLVDGNEIVVTVTAQDTSTTRTYTVTVTRAANAAPTALAASVTTDEDTAYTFAAADFNFTDSDGDALASVTVVTLPAEGALELDATVVTPGQSVPAADIGKLVFTPAANAHGDAHASFTFRVHDGTDESAAAYTMTVNVTAMNDPATGAPTISGTARVGQTLTAATTGHCGRGRPHQPHLRLPVDPGGRRRHVEPDRHHRGDLGHLHAGEGGCRQQAQGEGQLHRRRQ